MTLCMFSRSIMGRSLGISLVTDTKIGASFCLSRVKAQSSGGSRRNEAGSGGCAFDISGLKAAHKYTRSEVPDGMIAAKQCGEDRDAGTALWAAFNFEHTSYISGAEVESTPSALLFWRCRRKKRRGRK